MNGVIERLRKDHLNFAKLLSLIDRQAVVAAAGGNADLDALSDAVSYFADYRSQHHHPLEDALCERLKRARPAVATSIAGILREHDEIGARLAQFRELIVAVKKGQDISCTDFASAAKLFVQSEFAHMARENEQLLPAAVAVLAPEDWSLLEERMGRIQDPLFESQSAGTLDGLRHLISEPESNNSAALKVG